MSERQCFECGGRGVHSLGICTCPAGEGFRAELQRTYPVRVVERRALLLVEALEALMEWPDLNDRGRENVQERLREARKLAETVRAWVPSLWWRNDTPP